MNQIRVVPLRLNLLRRVAQDLRAKFYSPDDPLLLAGVTVVVPHHRGIVYLRHYLGEIINAGKPKPFLSPRFVTIEDLANQIALAAKGNPGRALDLTDQAWLLFRLVKDLGMYQDVAGSWDRFFGWGVRLAGIIDEIDRELVEAKDIQYPEDVRPEARALLERLSEIYQGFAASLDKHGFTTQGRRFRQAAEAAAAEAAEALALDPARTYLVGFYATSRAEDRIFRHLFDRGAAVWWHADPEDLPPLYRRWQEGWKARLVTVEEEAAAGKTDDQPELHFHEAYDLHAELRVAERVLAGASAGLPDQCALVLPDPSALVPMLYHIPEALQVNISIGYPLERSSVAALLERIMLVVEGSDKDGAYYYQDYLALVRHPYVRRLPTPGGQYGHIVLHLLEDKMRHYGRPFLNQADIRDLAALSYAEEHASALLASEGIDLAEAVAHLDRLHANLIRPWEKAKTPSELAATLRQTVGFLLEPFLGRTQFAAGQLLDNEFVHALGDEVIPSLEDALFADEPMAHSLLFTLLRDLVHMTRVPFEGQPLKGLQILGLLETRLLAFDKVIMLDVNEGILPAHEDVNPLLPELLRPAIGLPTKEKEEAITRYHFERLVGSAREVHLVWQASTATSASGLEGKKTRSRFVEALLWGKEAKAGSLLDHLIEREVLTIPAQALVKAEGLPRSNSDATKVATFIKSHAAKHGISATLLNTYLRCPASFLYRYILKLEPPESPLEEIDPAELGVLVHQALEAYFRPYAGREYIRARHNDPGQLLDLFHGLYGQSPTYRSLGPEKRIFLEGAVAHRLRGYLEAMPEATFIEGVEQQYSAKLETSLGNLALAGKVDRLDRRDGKRIILDYKTGSVDTFGAGHFEQALADLALPASLDYEGLQLVRDAIADLQLPLYVMLVAQSAPSGRKDAADILSAYVELRSPTSEQFKERYFVKPDRQAEIQDAYAAWFAETFPKLVAYVIDHIAHAPQFYRATDEADCAYCDYRAICGLTLA
ncbi:MAG TPA: PD-(D/E)XK nuclease family protein [bacterium]|nr:PD-(D/E)XK nuclease family protein [bacterium]